jgi:hypothetical protein
MLGLKAPLPNGSGRDRQQTNNLNDMSRFSSRFAFAFEQHLGNAHARTISWGASSRMIITG